MSECQCQCKLGEVCPRRGKVMPIVHWRKCQAGMVDHLDQLYARAPIVNPELKIHSVTAKKNNAWLDKVHSLWRELHTYAVTQWHATIEERRAWFASWLERVPNKFGCACRDHFTALLELLPPVFDSDVQFFAWSVRIHNEVNRKLSKSIVAYIDAMKIHAIEAQWTFELEPPHVSEVPIVTRRVRAPRRPARTVKAQRVIRPARRGGWFRQTGAARFVTSAQFQEDIKLLIGKIPSDVTAIAGVARSGLSAATMISMYLHLPMITIRQTLNDIVPTGNGWRLGGSKHVDPKGKILVVDDTVMTGNSLKAIAPLVQSQLGNAIYAAVYVNPLASRKPDIWAVDLGWPHLLEWNVFNSILSPSMAVDFDGILCRDCPPGSDDDGPRYLEFIRNAQPLYVPRRVPIPLIVTARIEKYRAETEEWLSRHGINWQRLVMHPAATLADRMRDDIPAYKAKHYKAWASKHRAMPGPIMFFESEDWQARRIAQLSKLMTVCPHTAGVY